MDARRGEPMSESAFLHSKSRPRSVRRLRAGASVTHLISSAGAAVTPQ